MILIKSALMDSGSKSISLRREASSRILSNLSAATSGSGAAAINAWKSVIYQPQGHRGQRATEDTEITEWIEGIFNIRATFRLTCHWGQI